MATEAVSPDRIDSWLQNYEEDSEFTYGIYDNLRKARTRIQLWFPNSRADFEKFYEDMIKFVALCRAEVRGIAEVGALQRPARIIAAKRELDEKGAALSPVFEQLRQSIVGEIGSLSTIS